MCVKRWTLRPQNQRLQAFSGWIAKKRPVTRQEHPAIIPLHTLRERAANQSLPLVTHHPAKSFVDLVNQTNIIQHQIADRRLMEQQGKLVARLFQLTHHPAQLFVLNLQLNLMHMEFVQQLAGLLVRKL